MAELPQELQRVLGEVTLTPSPSAEDFQDLLSVPYVRGGRDPSTGLDCFGLVLEVFFRCGLAIPDLAEEYRSGRDLLSVARKQASQWHMVRDYRVERKRPLLVVMRRHPTIHNHTGALVGESTLIHSYEETGVVMSDLSSPRLMRRVGGIYRWSPVALSPYKGPAKKSQNNSA